MLRHCPRTTLFAQLMPNASIVWCKKDGWTQERRTFRMVLVILRRIPRWCPCQGRHQPNSLQSNTPGKNKSWHETERKNPATGVGVQVQGKRRQGSRAPRAPLESGKTTDINLAPKLVTLTERSPFLSSYTPTVFPAPAPAASCAEAARRHSSARPRSASRRLAIGVARRAGNG